ncbi:MAG: BrnT family toxin [Candidatus Sulfotelmatobacter sp.]
MEFTWDARKDRLNRKKHHISFGTALHVFDDPYHVTTQDREVDGEPRWQTIGMIGAHNVLLVAHAVDDETGTIRIISARKATHAEWRIYAEGN